MPELPEVETIKEALKRAVEGAEICSVEVRNRHFRELVSDDFEERVTQTFIEKIYRKAKYIVIELTNGLSIIWHLGMSGKVKILDELPPLLEKHDHIIFKTSKGVVIYNDARRFGLITYTESITIDRHHLFSHIGLDPFDEKLTGQYLFSIFHNRKSAIKTTLLDQTIINGIGNIYASESLYEARISPLRSCSEITFTEVEALIKAIRKTLKKAIIAGGSTLRDYRKPDGSMGYFQNQHCVYNKTGQRCPNCICQTQHSSGIKKINQGGRSTFYCTHLQK